MRATRRKLDRIEHAVATWTALHDRVNLAQAALVPEDLPEEVRAELRLRIADLTVRCDAAMRELKTAILQPQEERG